MNNDFEDEYEVKYDEDVNLDEFEPEDEVETDDDIETDDDFEVDEETLELENPDISMKLDLKKVATAVVAIASGIACGIAAICISKR